MAEALGRAGQNAEGLAAIEEAITRSERTEEHWAMAELVRVKGELLLLQGAPGAAARPRITSGRRSTGRANKVRCPGNSAPPRASPGLLRDQGRLADAVACLQPIYDRFTEGFGTADLIAAKQLLNELGAAGHR